MVQNSLTDGILYCFEDLEVQLRLIKHFWTAVKTVFSNDWGLPPRRSRLMHGAGIAAMGFLMDTISDRHRRKKELTQKLFEAELSKICTQCHWTSGRWSFGGGKELDWSEVQNVPNHIQLLSNHLLAVYRQKS